MQSKFPATQSQQVTLANWRTAPFNKWAFHHVSELVPSAVIKNNPTAVHSFAPMLESELPDFFFEGASYSIPEFMHQNDTDHNLFAQLRNLTTGKVMLASSHRGKSALFACIGRALRSIFRAKNST